MIETWAPVSRRSRCQVADVRVVVNAFRASVMSPGHMAGILEIASVLVVNKADLPLAARTVRQFAAC